MLIFPSVTSRSRCVFEFLKDRNFTSACLLPSVSGAKYTFRNKDLTQKTLIDHVIIPEFSSPFIMNCNIDEQCPYDVSDHLPVYVSFDLNMLKISQSRMQYCVPNWDKTDALGKKNV